jgi:polyvinyl alcohol dehydrogenase (cytochrome)
MAIPRYWSAPIAFAAVLLLPSSAFAEQRPLPVNWTVYAGNTAHDADFAPPLGNAGIALQHGVSWRFAEANAMPLDVPLGKDGAALGPRNAPVKTTQFLGSAVGVTVNGDAVYAESDSGVVYALDAVTGKMRWNAPVDNAAMGNPLVVDGRVFVGTGDTGFSFSQVMHAQAGAKTGLVRGLSWSAVYAFDAATGKQLWRFATKGEDMSSECYDDGTLFFANGDGHVYALDPATGTLRWAAEVGGFDSMSSCAVFAGKVYAGFTDPNDLVAVDEKTGKIAWHTTFPNVANTGMGDNSPTIDVPDGQVIQVAVADAQSDTNGSTVDTAVLAVDAASGTIRWRVRLGRGASPPAYKAAVAMIHDGVIYVGSPVTSRLYALDAKTGSMRWSSDIPHHYAPGLGRGALTFHNGVLYESTGSYLYAWDPNSGRLIHELSVGGRFGIVNPVIVGETLFVANSWGWVLAFPVAQVHGP